MKNNGKTNLKELKRVINSMKHIGYRYYSGGRVEFKGKEVDLSATKLEPLSIAYSTLSQI